MDDKPPHLNRDEKVIILLAEYDAIEKMHAHFDILNMSMTAIITAGVFTVWGILIQSAFEPHAPINDHTYVNSVGVLALLLFIVLSVWIRYTTIHRCIVINPSCHLGLISILPGVAAQSLSVNGFWSQINKLGLTQNKAKP